MGDGRLVYIDPTYSVEVEERFRPRDRVLREEARLVGGDVRDLVRDAPVAHVRGMDVRVVRTQGEVWTGVTSTIVSKPAIRTFPMFW